MTGTWDLCGSPIRDRWRYLHKQRLGRGHYGADGDFFIVDFDQRRPLALLDLKAPGDEETDTEHELYYWLVGVGCPVFLLWIIDVDAGVFRIEQWDHKGNHRLDCITNTWAEYGAWEIALRAQR